MVAGDDDEDEGPSKLVMARPISAPYSSKAIQAELDAACAVQGVQTSGIHVPSPRTAAEVERVAGSIPGGPLVTWDDMPSRPA